ncbi:molecular chaperone DnaK [Nannocystis sp. ILAH1]|uniref:molecular chaperone DnaK n=1 Tax=unclassified Nannocystis TaxID=2627009 RepID=UPI00226DDE78|nr:MULTISPECIES: molecular chaperone DnaK [unclassified Nannocystis]MCY0995000.1 molecular chaperone DnaK [Nannocystis sp. ILAH1]MCY1069676.1 molecular chaperone DnaK [Nannocystis sp. RBIL2]
MAGPRPSPILGIDLGTTNSCAAVMDGGEVRVLVNAEGSRTTPSVVAFAGQEILVGTLAQRQAAVSPATTIYAAKRLIGRSYAAVAGLRARLTYDLVPGEHGDAWIEVAGRTIAPAEVGAHVLASLRDAAEAAIGQPVTRAVITVPAYFDDAQRQATRDAGTIAGLRVERIVNEPTAAALAYGLADRKDRPPKIVAVYDLGGGTFDLSLLELRSGVFEVLATAGDTLLGGEDFDAALVDHLAEGFQREHGIDLRRDRAALVKLQEAAQRAKHELSWSLATDIQVPFVAAAGGKPLHLQASLSRLELERLVRPLIQRTLEPCRRALADAKLRARDVDEVILVGGQTRMPRVIEAVAEFFGRAPNTSPNPDEVVAVGAAIQGAVLAGEVEEVLLLDVVPLDIGVETQGGVFTPLIPRNTTVPTRRSEVFGTTIDGQTAVDVHVQQGLREMAADNQTLARLRLSGIAEAPRGTPQIKVQFEVDADGILHVSARELGAGAEVATTVQPAAGLTRAQVEQLAREAAAARQADAVRKDAALLRNRAEALAYACERAAEGLPGLQGPQRAALRAEVATLRELLAAAAPATAIEAALLTLERSSQQIYAALLGGESTGSS